MSRETGRYEVSGCGVLYTPDGDHVEVKIHKRHQDDTAPMTPEERQAFYEDLAAALNLGREARRGRPE